MIDGSFVAASVFSVGELDILASFPALLEADETALEIL
jgi:hypothetical protein